VYNWIDEQLPYNPTTSFDENLTRLEGTPRLVWRTIIEAKTPSSSDGTCQQFVEKSMSRQYKTGQADLEKLDRLILKKTKEDTKPISYRL